MIAARYVALAGEPGRLREWLCSFVPPKHPPERLNRVFDSPDLVIFASPETPFLLLQERRGVLIGGLVSEGERNEQVDSVTGPNGRHVGCRRSGWRSENEPGAYVGFIRDQYGVAVLRDRSRAMPLHFREAAGIRFYVSHADLLKQLGLGAFAAP